MTTPGGHFYPLFKTTEYASIFKISENGMGVSFSSVFLNPSSKHPIITTSWLAEDECAPFKAQETACWSPPTLGSQRLGWTQPPLSRLLSLQESPGRGGKKQVDTAASFLPHAHCTLLLRMQGSTWEEERKHHFSLGKN